MVIGFGEAAAGLGMLTTLGANSQFTRQKGTCDDSQGVAPLVSFICL